MSSTYKRRPITGSAQAPLAWTAPRFNCFACHDTGIVVDPDGRLAAMLSDYDRLPDGRRMVGSDTALICHCKAAFPEMGPDGQQVRGGLRDGEGPHMLNSDYGDRWAGAEIDRDLARRLHSERAAAWRETADTMNLARQNGEVPWFIAETRAQLMAQLAAVPEQSRAGLQSIGSLLGAA
jgi:hypothetical protein